MKPSPKPLSNAEISRQLAALAQALQSKRENPYKVRAYRRAASTIAGLNERIDPLVRTGGNLTRYPNIGPGIAATIRDLVEKASSGQLELLLAGGAPETAALQEYPRLDPKQLLRAYKKLGVDTVQGLKEKLLSGEVARTLGLRAAFHFQQAFRTTQEIYLDDAYALSATIQRYLAKQCRVEKSEAAGPFRRRVETIGELSFVVLTNDFKRVVEKMKAYARGTDLVKADDAQATFHLSVGIPLTLHRASAEKWGPSLIVASGSDAHLRKLEAKAGSLTKWIAAKKPPPSEKTAYESLGLDWIPPELREGRDEVELAAKHRLPTLVTVRDIKGELHAHSTTSDGSHTIEEMAAKAKSLGYEYLGITDHSQSLKIARGVPEEDLRRQIRAIDRLNEKELGIRILKSAEVDILADGTLDYPDELLAELDYTVCSIHSRFALGKKEQTERIMRAMDNPHFNILGHTTGRLLLKRPGYEVDWPRLIRHAAAAKVTFEINASPDRLDLSAEAAREVHAAGIKIAVNTDAHHVKDFDYLYCGIDMARRAGLEAADVLNCYSWTKLARLLKR